MVPPRRGSLARLLGVGVLGAAVTAASVAAWTALYRRPPHAGEAVAITADDGWPLALQHYAARGPAVAPWPLILCHGVVTNAYSMDLDDEHSLARWLAGRGFDVWLLDLRGHGDSGKPGLFGSLPGRWSFDDYVDRDVPAAIAAVRARTGAARVAWVGHSMGGMVAYAHLGRAAGRGDDGGVARLATLGSPASFAELSPTMRELGGLAAPDLLPLVPLASPTLLLLPFAGRTYGPLERMTFADGNLEPDVWRAFLGRGVDDESTRLADEFRGWIHKGRWTSPRDGFDFEAGLARLTAPLLVVAGAADSIAARGQVRRGHDGAGSAEKTWAVIGRQSGGVTDYGHMDLLLGPRAAREVFPVIETFLRRP